MLKLCKNGANKPHSQLSQNHYIFYIEEKESNSNDDSQIIIINRI
jgi:hypothetical protein